MQKKLKQKRSLSANLMMLSWPDKVEKKTKVSAMNKRR